MKLQHFKELDGVRAIAALMIMFFHFFQNLPTQNHLLFLIKKLAVFGQTGVSLFFVLSGFLITRILVNTKHSGSYFSSFYLRRALRIFPLYYLALVIYEFAVPLFRHLPAASFNQQIWYWVYLQNIAMTFDWKNSGPGHFWSLAIEEHFYLFWPLAIYYLNLKKIKITIGLTVLCAFIIKVVMLIHGLSVFTFTLTRMDDLAIGAFLAILEAEAKLTHKNLKTFIGLFGLSALSAITLFIFFSGEGLDIIQSVKFTVIALVYFSLIASLIILNKGNWLKKSFQVSLLTYTGRISYGLYVYHPLCYFLVLTYFNAGSILINFVMCVALTYIMAGLSYYVYESRFLALKRRFSYNN